MSSGKTTNYALNQWNREDLFLMEEFNQDNAILDEAIHKCSLVKLSSEKLTATANSWTVDLTQWGSANFSEFQLYLSGWHNSTGVREMYLTMNGIANSTSYLTGDLAQSPELTTNSAILLGKLAGAASNNHGGMKIELRLFSKGVEVVSSGLCSYTNATHAAYHCVGSPSATTLVTRSNLRNVTIFCGDQDVMLAAGSILTVYGVKG